MGNARSPSEEPTAGRNDLLEVSVEREGSYARVVAVGEIDMATAPDLDKALGAVTRDQDVRRVVLDLAGVTFLDSSGVEVLCKAANGSRRDGFDFGVTRPSDHIRRLFVLTGIDQMVHVVDP